MDIEDQVPCKLIRQYGFSLVELMIAIPFGLLVTLGALQVFTSNVQSIRLQNASSRVQENGRMATELMMRDIRAADFWGCMRDTSLIVNHLDSTDPDYDASLAFTGSNGITGENNVTSKAIGTINVKDTSDVLTLRGANGLANIRVVPPYMTVSSATIHINTGASIAQGQTLMITDCTGADLISNTSANTSSSGNIIHNTGTLAVTGAVSNAIKNLSHTYNASAQLLVPYVKTYFVGLNSAGSYSLFRSENGDSSELVRGINDLQLVYGEDTSGNGSVDSFLNASSVTDMNAVRSIRVSLTAESDKNLFSTPLERTYSITSNIRNRTLK